MGDSINRKSLCVMATSGGGFFSGGFSSLIFPHSAFSACPAGTTLFPARLRKPGLQTCVTTVQQQHQSAVGVSLLLIFLCIIHRHFSRRIFPTHGNK
jgi:hypothetical protein